jgi:hypothetical protein
MKNLKGAVLIIGSLLWDNSQLRVDWRNDFLDIDNKKLVSAPIRYGRLSNDRGTYTMVFSSNCLTKNRMGKGFLVPLRLDRFNIQEHCEELIKVERINNPIYENRYNYSFFAVGLLPNPNSNNPRLLNLVNSWHHNFNGGFNVNHYKVGKESPIIDQQGLLKMNWSEEFGEIDFIICTVIKPKLNRYPYPKKIANLMNDRKDFEYFEENQKIGITTFQDKKIKEYLK